MPTFESNAMATVEQHYAQHLAPIYEWMLGGAEPAFALGKADLEVIGAPPGFAVDLGAGFGMHAVPLARAGHRVLAVDSSAHLIERLRAHAAGLAVEVVQDDLLDFERHLPAPERPSLILCMGDTLTHLARFEDVERLAESVARALAPGGRFVGTFRDYSRPPEADRRFILVRADQQRILTCCLEMLPERLRVHDVIHERSDEGWGLSVSSYEKLRLAPARVESALARAGLRTRRAPPLRGMVRLIAERRLAPPARKRSH